MTAPALFPAAGGSTVLAAVRTARKAHRCRAALEAGKAGAEPCDGPTTEIPAGALYLEIGEGDDQFHPLRYHGPCGVRAWALEDPADGTWEAAIIESWLAPRHPDEPTPAAAR